VGIADGIVVLTADVFRSCRDGFSPLLGAQIWVVNKEQLLAGESAASASIGPDHSYESLAPVQSLSPTATEYVVGVDVPAARAVHLLAVDGIPPAAVRVQEIATPPISPLQAPPPAQQPAAQGGGRSASIETNDDRVLDSVWEDGRLWFASNSGCTPPGDNRLRSCARVIELSTATRSVTWDTDISQPGAHLFYPAIRPDAAGNLVVVYGESGVAEMPRLMVVGRAPDGTFSSSATVALSASQHEGGRFGDYFAAARDPQHPEIVWVAGEYGVDVAGVRGWNTSIASVQVTSAGIDLPAVTRALPPGVRAQAAVGRVGSAVRLGYTALDDGASVRQQVVVRKKRKVVFDATTNRGAVSATQSYYVLWHPAKRLRGTFRWCVHTISPSGASSPDSCSTVTLR
jgi:hypothetical protein